MQRKCIKLSDDFAVIKQKLHKLINLESNGEICFEYISDFKNAKIIRKTIEEICDIFNISFRLKNRLVLIIDELNNNAIEYGSLKGETNKIYFSYKNKKNKLHLDIKVEDTGHGSKSKKAKDMDAIKSEKGQKSFNYNKSIRGRGLFLITQSVVDKLYFKDSSSGGLLVGIKKEIDK